MNAIAEVVKKTIKQLREHEKGQSLRVKDARDALQEEEGRLSDIQKKIRELETEGEKLGIQKDCGPMEIIRG